MATPSSQLQYQTPAGPKQPLIGPVRNPNVDTPSLPSPAITADSLNTPQTPVKLAPTVPNTAAAALIEQASSANTYAQNKSAAEIAREQKVADQTTELNKNKKDLSSILGDLGNMGSDQAKLEQKAGIADKRAALDEITSQIESKTLAARRQIEDLQKAGGGLQGGQNIEIDRIQKESARELADLSIIQNARNRNLATAQSIVDRKVELETADLKQKADNIKFFYNENKDFLNKDEQRQFEKATKEADRVYEEKKLKTKSLEDTKLNYMNTAVALGLGNSALQALQKAGTAEDVIKVAGQYGVISLDDQIKLKNLKKVNAEIDAIGAPAITNPDAAKYAGALSTILGSTKLTKEQKATLVSSINNGEEPFSIIKNQAKDIMGQTLATTLDKYETAKTQLQSIDSLLAQFYSKGGDTGIFKGNVEKTLNKLGEVNDPNLVSIATNIAAALQIYRNAVSGTAYSVQEGADIASIFPGINKSEGLNKAIINGRMQAFDTTIDAAYSNTLGKKTFEALKQGEQQSQQQEQAAAKQIAAFTIQSAENKARYDEIKKIAPGASVTEIAKELGIIQ